MPFVVLRDGNRARLVVSSAASEYRERADLPLPPKSFSFGLKSMWAISDPPRVAQSPFPPVPL
eukprot:3200123-Pleurochrysis_carterae.AAC.1